MKTAIIYARVSSRKQAEKGKGLEDQVRACREFAKKEGYHVEDVIEDPAISGGKPPKDRPGFSKAWLALTEGSVDAIVAYDWSRIGRDKQTHAGESLRLVHESYEYGDGIRFVSGEADVSTAAGYLSGTVQSAVSAFHRIVTGEKVSLRMRELWSNGDLGSGITPYAITWDKKTRQWGYNKAEARIIREMFKLSVNGHSAQAIADRLNDRGVPPPPRNDKRRKRSEFKRAPMWWATTISKFLRSPVYRGALPVFDGELVVHAPGVDTSDWPDATPVPREDFPVIVKHELWSQAQEATRRRSKRKEYVKMTRDTWTGRVLCGVCDLRFLGRPSYNRLKDGGRGKNDGVRRLLCPGRLDISWQSGWRPKDQPCTNRNDLWEYELEELIKDAIYQLDDPKVLAGAVMNRLTDMDSKIADLEASLGPDVRSRESMERKRRNIVEAYVKDKKISKGDFDAALTEINKQMVRIDKATRGKLGVLSEIERLTKERDEVYENLNALGEELGDGVRKAIASTKPGSPAWKEYVRREILVNFAAPLGEGWDADRLARLLDLKVIVPAEGKPELVGNYPIGSQGVGCSRV